MMDLINDEHAQAEPIHEAQSEELHVDAAYREGHVIAQSVDDLGIRTFFLRARRHLNGNDPAIEDFTELVPSMWVLALELSR
jgi:hypothetical protein